MILDALTLLSDAQALSATGFSTNTYDLGNVTPKRDPGAGEPLCIAYAVDVAADLASGNETYQFDFVQSANANLSSPDVLESIVIDKAVLVAGYKFYQPFPTPRITKQYIGAQYTLGGTTPSITITAAIVPFRFVQNEKIYAKGYTIS